MRSWLGGPRQWFASDGRGRAGSVRAGCGGGAVGRSADQSGGGGGLARAEVGARSTSLPMHSSATLPRTTMAAPLSHPPEQLWLTHSHTDHCHPQGVGQCGCLGAGRAGADELARRAVSGTAGAEGRSAARVGNDGSSAGARTSNAGACTATSRAVRVGRSSSRLSC